MDWEIEVQLAKADDEVKRLQQWQDQITREGKQREREEQLHHERELYEAKIKLKSELKLSSENVGAKDELQAKLPKLTITKFNGPEHIKIGQDFGISSVRQSIKAEFQALQNSLTYGNYSTQM